MNKNISLVPFQIAPDCHFEKSGLIYEIIINLKLNLFKKRIITTNFFSTNHLAHYKAATLLGGETKISNIIYSP